MSETSRRQFLRQCGSGVAGILTAPRLSGLATSQPSIRFPASPRERVAVSSYPFREFIAGSDHKTGNPTIELKEFAAHVVERFEIHRIEPWSAHMPSTNPQYLAEFRAAVEKARAAVVNVAADGEHSPYALDTSERQAAIAFAKQWVEVAVAIGSPSIRMNIPPANDAKPDVGRLAESLRRVVEYASARNVVVHLENDNPVSEDPFFLVQVIQTVNSPWLHALPDFGNTLSAHEEDYAYRAIDAMFRHAYGICHVKDGEVDEQGKATHVDLERTFATLRRDGYKGYCSIEYDAPGDPYKMTAKLIDQTVTHLS
ncbi:MAG TPA: sugar phosphate isomerase/epimerase family protein [Terriglobales bacterium]|nr:sugar phosphate isomerase/epimerase family protein [Terriglobales bacterium]